MNIEEYKPLALRTFTSLGTQREDLMHMAAGLAGESAEVLDEVKKHFAYGRPLNVKHVIEEVGDAIFYMNGLLDLLGVDFGDVLTTNIKKLEARYPDLRFDADRANNRDLEREQEAMK